MVSKLETARAQFALNLLRTSSKGDQNCFLSPVSMSVALAMTYVDAADKKKLQMNQVMFSGTTSDEEVHASFRELVSKLSEAKNGCELTTANKMYAPKGVAMLSNFADKLSKHYRNSVHAVDFINETDSARKETNGKDAETTKQRIKDLLAPDVLTTDIRFVLFNTIYFKDERAEQFMDYRTEHATFYATSNEEREVDMMYLRKYFKYSDHPDCEVLGMYYKGSDLAMYVFLPKKRDGLAELENNLTGARMLRLIKGGQFTEVEVHLPNFKLEMNFRLDETLSSLGISNLFDYNKADLSNITGDRNICCSTAIHKVFAEMGLADPPPTFVADHPFLFTISDGKSLFFLGRFTG
uniref:Serpin domain-containing protein n=1 Tax=Plectus sambesii TaxID=2011161 RepID=A0A914X7T4_9BILA